MEFTQSPADDAGLQSRICQANPSRGYSAICGLLSGGVIALAVLHRLAHQRHHLDYWEFSAHQESLLPKVTAAYFRDYFESGQLPDRFYTALGTLIHYGSWVDYPFLMDYSNTDYADNLHSWFGLPIQFLECFLSRRNYDSQRGSTGSFLFDADHLPP